ncbi:hypothetical protein HNR62_000325 [Oceanisphaera litoralis]|uniref:hypothetical protein n=1 Tax=Oceanisphaera litoralis TaxID=225144 RepID=UPI001959D5ED|nr:hypothetical protein [Oceanisphaera litoralis]MBM7454496.1 hypothetical protein [Oceanisphaera litoralis]
MITDEQMVEAHDLTKKISILLRQDVDPENPRHWDNVGIMACEHRHYNLGDKDGIAELNDALFRALMWVMADNHPGLHEQGYDLGNEYIPCPAHCEGADDCAECDGRQEVINEFHAEDTDDMVDLYHLYEDQVPGDLKLLILPLYLYDHSGLTMSTGPFGCRWDSGQVGWIFATHQRVEFEWGGDWDKAKSYLEGEVETYDQYLTGDIWGFEVWEHDEEEDDPTEGELLDSCWGFFGDDPETNGMWDHWAPEWRQLEPEVVWN